MSDDRTNDKLLRRVLRSNRTLCRIADGELKWMFRWILFLVGAMFVNIGITLWHARKLDDAQSKATVVRRVGR